MKLTEYNKGRLYRRLRKRIPGSIRERNNGKNWEVNNEAFESELLPC